MQQVQVMQFQIVEILRKYLIRVCRALPSCVMIYWTLTGTRRNFSNYSVQQVRNSVVQEYNLLVAF
jgi:hypothetical protein